MAIRWGPGPVFVSESVAATRRWQLFAARSAFVFSLLAALVISWQSLGLSRNAGALDRRLLAQLGSRFYSVVAPIQVALLLLAAPAATATSGSPADPASR